MKFVKRGYALGPFIRPPFPNAFCPFQPLIRPWSLVKKSKWIDDGTRRIVFNYSYPSFCSTNDLVSRRSGNHLDPDNYHWPTFTRMIDMCAMLTSSCVMTRPRGISTVGVFMTLSIGLQQILFQRIWLQDFGFGKLARELGEPDGEGAGGTRWGAELGGHGGIGGGPPAGASTLTKTVRTLISEA